MMQDMQVCSREVVLKKNVLMYIQIISVLFVFAPSMFFSELYNLYIQNKQDTAFLFFFFLKLELFQPH